jgi:hypothetical protein
VAFWGLALGYVDEPGYDFEDGAPLVDPDGVRPAIGFLPFPRTRSAADIGTWERHYVRARLRSREAPRRPWDAAKDREGHAIGAVIPTDI